MWIPGEQRSPYPDEVGARAGVFAAAIRDDDMEQAWVMLSKETRGMRFGVWATQHNVDMQVAYRAAYDSTHPMRGALLADFRQIVLRFWSLDAHRPGCHANSLRGRHACLCLPPLWGHERRRLDHAPSRHVRGDPPDAAGRGRVAGGPARMAVFSSAPGGLGQGVWRHLYAVMSKEGDKPWKPRTLYSMV